MPSRTLLIDADSMVYAAAAGAQEKIAVEGGMLTPIADAHQGESLFDAAISGIVRQVPGNVNLFLNDVGGNWRRDVLPSYKSNRDPSKRPLLFDHLREYAQRRHSATWFPQLEADDAVGMHSSLKLAVMVSVDKDLDTVPGMHFNPMKPERGVYVLTAEQADDNHLRQAVLGDPVDGYGGATGFGKKKLEKFLAGRALTWPLVVEVFERVGMTVDDALRMARVAYILRSKSEYRPKTRVVKLWRPA